MAQWEKIDSKVIFEHPRITLAEDKVLLPEGQEIDYLTFVGYPDFVTIIAVDSQGRLLLTDEHAYPVNKSILQFSEGVIDEGEDVLSAAKRELSEETGCAALDMKVIGSNLNYHRRTTALQFTVLATGVWQSGEPDTELEEGTIGFSWKTEDEIWQLIADGKIIQKNALAAWSIYQAHKRHAR